MKPSAWQAARGAFPGHNADMHVLLGFLTMGAIAVVIWKVLARQEAADPDFERRLKADERRALSNRQADARRAFGTAPPPDAGEGGDQPPAPRT